MRDIFLARQPICDRNLQVLAYELLFRGGDENRADIQNAAQATSQVLLNALVEFGLDNVVGSCPAYVNIPQVFLDFQCLPVDKERIVLEILEDVAPDEGVIALLQHLQCEGYRIALDDFVLSPATEALVPMAEIIKLDVRALGREETVFHVNELREYGVRTLLAEKVETMEEFEWCRDLGFDLFQGYFFCKPRMIRGRTASNNRLVSMQLLARLRDPRVETRELEAIIGRDPVLSYKLLNYINSSAVGVRCKVESIRKAISLLGLEPLRLMATLITLSRFDDKPRAIVNTGIMRAKMCEVLSKAIGRLDADAFYTVGLFSILDTLLDTTMSEALKTLPLSDELKGALLHFEGVHGNLLRCVVAIERGDWSGATSLGLSAEVLNKAWLEAIAASKACDRVLDSARGAAPRQRLQPA
ncbi:MAG: HDOD domain-containing protein [Planctomycetaceae bacterium]|nr:HDOD domain-containing protein [Planctomycetaceae bacterium]